MELTPATNTTATAPATVVGTPEPGTEIPTRNQSAPFTNGVLKRHAPLHHHHGHPVVVTYKECLKNHAAAIGGHAVDGCGEFMPTPPSNPSDPSSLKCAACGCHRNFHRRDPDITATHLPPHQALDFKTHRRSLPPQRRASPNSDDDDDDNPISPNDSPSPPPISSTYPHMLLALGGGQQGGHHQQEHHHHRVAAAAVAGHAPPAAVISNSTSRKRFRTKFTQDQKEKMLEFSGKIGWKIQKKDEDIINEFLNGIGVEKGVFKVWMHNNKNNFSGKKDQLQISSPNDAATAGTVNTVLPGLTNTTTGIMGGDNNNGNHGSNGLNIYGQEMSSIRIQNLSGGHELQIPTANGPDQDISTGTSGAGTNGSNSSSS